MYERLLRHLLFAFSPHAAHGLGTLALAPLEYGAPLRSLVRGAWAPPDGRLAVDALGLRFPSPVGLAGGFDKNATRPWALATLGFGFLELGTITAQAQGPNPRPNLFRLPADRALINRLGFPNDGAAAVVARLAARRPEGGFGVPVGLSIGKSRAVEVEPLEPVLDDYRESFRLARTVADFVVVNVSSPNTKNLRALQGPALARALFAALAAERRRGGAPVPLLVKVAPDLSNGDLEGLLDAAMAEGLDGVVATNTTVRRDGLRTPAAEVDAIGAGGLSGPPVRARALEVVARARAQIGPGPTVIGVGGIETGADALAFIEAGANLVQIYTGFIYRGPGAPRAIAAELAALVSRAGARSVGELVGRGAR